MHSASNHDSEQLRLLLQKDGAIFLGIIDKYVKRIKKGGVIIDAGCGTGSYLSALNPYLLNSYHVIGVDNIAPSEETLDYLSSLLYVAITRTRHRLVIPYIKESGFIARMHSCL